ncbi:hypothetical protein [Fulvimonas soli]|jgi:hypothetical protein|uniref:Uncharacterized protein n=1 Tax=Fulvimonas soli TaxID=155197 RepID=A0A316I2P3_9GAMM|nr:hypothetical protein [Fulvimonas soli]PWK86626.1 hypothetical protein C7456_10716 [Fulvimonas soli]TNY25554.1 hypothetical protein BV497_13385 [Fulvimonas soli]
MSAVWQLWLQLWKRLPVLAALASLLWLAALALPPWLGDGSAALLLPLGGLGSLFWHLGLGMVLRGLCRPEILLLPGFRRALLWLGLLDLAQWVLLPALLAAVAGLPHLPVIAAGGVLVAAFGLAGGSGRRTGLAFWAIAIAAGWMPRAAAQLAQALLASPLTPALLLATAALLLTWALRPLLRVTDLPVQDSPLESTSLGRANAVRGDGTPPARGALGRRLRGLFDQAAQRALERALARYRRSPGAAQRLALVRRLLLPHDNPEAIVLRLAVVAAFVTFYFFAAMHRQRFSAAAVGAYAILLALSRFPQLGRGMLRMRPNLADLYLTLAPRTRGEYQKTVADALWLLVPVSTLTALAYTLLGIALVHAAEPGRMLVAAAIVGAAASLVALGVHLIGPEGNVGRGLVNLVVVLGAMLAYWGGYWLLGALGLALGAATLGVLALSFGVAVWFAAQKEYQQREPRFDAPLG